MVRKSEKSEKKADLLNLLKDNYMFGKHIHSLDDSDKVCIFFLAMFGVMMTFVGFLAIDTGRPILTMLFLFVGCFLFGVAVHEMFVRNEKWTMEQIEKLLHEQQEKNLEERKRDERETYRGEKYFPSVETVLRNKKTEELLERHDRLVQARKRLDEAYEDEDEQAADPTVGNPIFKSLLCEENENVDVEPTEGTDVDMDDCRNPKESTVVSAEE